MSAPALRKKAWLRCIQMGAEEDDAQSKTENEKRNEKSTESLGQSRGIFIVLSAQT